MGFLDILKQFSPLEEEETTTAPAVVRAPSQAAPAPSPTVQAPVIQEELPQEINASAVDQYVQRRADVQAPKINIDDLIATSNENEGSIAKLDSRLEQLRDEYLNAQKEASSRQFGADIFASIGNNAGLIAGGLQGMNTKAAVTAPNVSKITSPDIIGRADKDHQARVGNLLKQYKGLKDGTLTPKDILQARIAQGYMEQRADQINANSDTNFKQTGIRGVGMKLKDQADNELSDKQTDSLKDIDGNLAAMSDIMKEAGKFKDKLGPNAADIEASKEGRAGGVVRALSPIDKEYVAFRHKLKSTKAAYQKMLSGLTLTTTEMAEMQSYIPNEKMPYDSLMANAKAFEKRVKQLRDRELGGLKKFQGKNVAGYADKETGTSAPNGQDVVEKNGKTYKWNPAAGKYQPLVK